MLPALVAWHHELTGPRTGVAGPIGRLDGHRIDAAVALALGAEFDHLRVDDLDIICVGAVAATASGASSLL